MATSQDVENVQQQLWSGSQPDLGESCTQDGFLWCACLYVPRSRRGLMTDTE